MEIHPKNSHFEASHLVVWVDVSHFPFGGIFRVQPLVLYLSSHNYGSVKKIGVFPIVVTPFQISRHFCFCTEPWIMGERVSIFELGCWGFA